MGLLGKGDICKFGKEHFLILQNGFPLRLRIHLLNPNPVLPKFRGQQCRLVELGSL